MVGLADPVWGETVHAVVVLHEGARLEGDELLAFAARPAWPATSGRGRSSFIAEAEMPRTATGKIMHRVLRDRLAGAPALGRELGRDRRGGEPGGEVGLGAVGVGLVAVAAAAAAGAGVLERRRPRADLSARHRL